MTYKVIPISLCLIVIACSFWVFTPYSQAQDVFISVGNGSGTQNSQNNFVTVSLENTVSVKGIQLAIKDEGDFLSAIGCKTVGRASTLTCDVNEKQYGWTVLQLYSFGGDSIEEGIGPILSINYAVKGNAPPEECFPLRILKKAREIESKASDENNNPLSVISVSGKFCVIGGADDEDEDTTTTTSSSDDTETDFEEPLSDTASNQAIGISNLGSDKSKPSSSGGTSQQTYGRPRRTIPATTTSIDTSDRQVSARRTVSSRQGTIRTDLAGTTSADPVGSSRTRVIVSPESGTLTSGDSILLDPQTLNDGILVDGDYNYEIKPSSSIGSTMSDDGQFTAGKNTSSDNVEETIKITDTANKNAWVLIVFTIEGKKPSSGNCTLSISPSSATIGPGKSLQLTPHNSEECKEGVYEWKVNSKIGSSINDQGFYKAATNTNSTPALDIVMVTDTVNQVSTDIIITVLTSPVATLDVAEVSSDTPNLEPAGIAGRKTSPKIFIPLTLLIFVIGFFAIRKFKH